MFIRTQSNGSRTYLLIVDNQRVDGKVKQRVLHRLGRLDELLASGQLDSRLPSVAAAMGNTRASASRSGACIQRVVSAESLTGIVFGMAQTLVNPPAAAARVPLAMVSL